MEAPAPYPSEDKLENGDEPRLTAAAHCPGFYDPSAGFCVCVHARLVPLSIILYLIF